MPRNFMLMWSGKKFHLTFLVEKNYSEILTSLSKAVTENVCPGLKQTWDRKTSNSSIQKYLGRYYGV